MHFCNGHTYILAYLVLVASPNKKHPKKVGMTHPHIAGPKRCFETLPRCSSAGRASCYQVGSKIGIHGWIPGNLGKQTRLKHSWISFHPIGIPQLEIYGLSMLLQHGTQVDGKQPILHPFEDESNRFSLALSETLKRSWQKWSAAIWAVINGGDSGHQCGLSLGHCCSCGKLDSWQCNSLELYSSKGGELEMLKS